MFVRIKTKKQNGKTYNYLQIVENIWDKRRKRGTQKVLLSLGRLETIDRAKIDKLVSALSSLTEEVLVITPILRTDLSPEAEEILKTLRIQPPPRIINLKP